MCSHVLLEAAVQLLCISRNLCAPFISDESWAMFGPMVEDIGYVAKEGRKSRILEKEGKRERVFELSWYIIDHTHQIWNICIFKKTICEEF